MKKALKVIAGVALAGCMLLPLAACSNTDNSEDVKQLQQQVQDLQTEIDSLKNDNVALTGSPKFNYGINETIPYYVSGTKIFDFTVTSFTYQNSNSILYTVNFISQISSTDTTTFTAKLYDTVKGTLYLSGSNEAGTMYFLAGDNNSNKKILTLYYEGQPFASITATPTPKN